MSNAPDVVALQPPRPGEHYGGFERIALVLVTCISEIPRVVCC